MNPRVREALLWGVVGLLTFLVLVQGYEILGNATVDLTVKAGGAVVVGVASTVATYLASARVGDDDPTEDEPAADEPTPDEPTADDAADRAGAREDGADGEEAAGDGAADADRENDA